MAPALSKEAVLAGSVDLLCLACESYLRSEREALRHVGTAGHRACWGRTRYLPLYERHRVRKVNKWYLCEFCNVLLTTITKVRLHVEELTHKENMQVTERVGDDIVSRGIVIHEEAWHGFINDATCVVCNVEFEDRDIHVKETTHVINLIQSKISYDCDNVYRKIDDTTFHCLSCNQLLLVAEVTAHFGDIKHKELLQKYNNDVTDLNEPTYIETETAVGHFQASSINNNSDEDIKNGIHNEIRKCNDLSDGTEKNQNTNDESDLNKANENTKGNNKIKSDILDDNIPTFLKEGIHAEVGSSSAVTEKCSVFQEFDSIINKKDIKSHTNSMPSKHNETIPILLETDQTNKHKSPEIRSNETTKENLETKMESSTSHDDRNSRDNVVQKLAEEYGLNYVSKENKVYCQTCNEIVPSPVKKLKKHVNGQLHKSKIKLQSGSINAKDSDNRKKIMIKKCNLKRVPSNQFLKKIATVKTDLDEYLVLNDKYCINLLSYTFLTVLNRKQARCQLCEINLPVKDMKEHNIIPKHWKAAAEVPVILHADSEFIREVGSETFHCGFCNIVGSWDDMGNHLKTIQHRENKTSADWRLHMYLPEITRSPVERQTYNDFLMTLQLSNIN